LVTRLNGEGLLHAGSDFADDLHHAVAGLDAGLVRRTAGVDVADLDARLGVIPDGEDAEERLGIGGYRPFQYDLVQLDLLLAAQDLEANDVTLVLRAERLLDLRLTDDGLAVDLLDGVAGLEATLFGGGTGRDRGDRRRLRVRVLGLLHGDTEQAA